jgi:hypothetical protein
MKIKSNNPSNRCSFFVGLILPGNSDKNGSYRLFFTTEQTNKKKKQSISKTSVFFNIRSWTL